jgi:predicted type IV restriction endonuclease
MVNWEYMNREQAKEKIKKLIAKYESLSIEQKKRYNEQQTKDHFIRPLFEALGWDFENDVWPETDVSGKRVDYAFKFA